MIKDAIELLSGRKDLPGSLTQQVMEEIMTGRADTDSIVSFLSALSEKGETIEEITAAASVMRRHVTRIHTDKEPLLDTCGTGGDKKGIFNVSTAVAFVASGAGITVAKHGNRSVSSCCGSADILEAQGVDINMPKEKVERCLTEIGIAFLFAPNFHPAMKYAMPARKKIGARTIFNILGPLTNPAGATHQLVGVYDRGRIKVLAAVLGNLGTAHALVVHSEDGMDEITTTAKTFACEEKNGALKEFEIDPRDYGFAKAKLEDLKRSTIPDNVRAMNEVLEGEPGPCRDIVLLNAAFAIFVADKAKTIKEGISLATESIDSGAASRKLNLLKGYS
ncbi:MAG: anthranilate phosphoribosyltransferase [Candidatus Omnitrophica bacterium]|nr:anthranilate phosphoribosyltransferase [Candidatus Omnitrophota bacterium]